MVTAAMATTLNLLALVAALMLSTTLEAATSNGEGGYGRRTVRVDKEEAMERKQLVPAKSTAAVGTQQVAEKASGASNDSNNNVTVGARSLESVESEGAAASVVTQSILTFVGVFLVCCAVILAVFSWRRFTDPSYRITLPYQYSALSQIDADPDDEEELGNLENNLHLLVEDSSSDDDKEGEEEEEEEKPEKTGEKTSKKKRSRAEEIADEGDDDVFADADAPATLLVTENTTETQVGGGTAAAAKSAEKGGRVSIGSSGSASGSGGGGKSTSSRGSHREEDDALLK